MRRILKAVAAAAGVLVFSGLPGAGGEARAAVFNHTAVGPHDTDQYTRYFRAGELVTVVVAGDGDTDLDLYVYGPCGRLAGKDDDYSDVCVVRFVAPESGRYTIRVKNLGVVSNVYDIGVD